MIRQTSINAYLEIKEKGLLSKRRWQVYEVLYQHGPLTGREVNKILATARGNNSSTFIGRLSELRDLGIVYECGEKFDSETNQTVLLWDVTDKLPIKLEKQKRIKCKHCGGRGYFIEQQTKLL